MRTDIAFVSEGRTLRGWLYRRMGPPARPPPS